MRWFAARRLLGLVALAALEACAPVPGVAAAATNGKAVDTEAASSSRVSLFRYPWIWTDERGASVAFSRWRGEPVVLAAFYTSCRRTCPRTIQTMRTVDAALRREHRAAQFFLVTLDPSNDTPDVLRQFKASERLPESWHLLVGSVAQTRDLTDLLDIHVMDLDPHLVHEGKIVIFDSQGMPSKSLSSSDGEPYSL